MPDKTENPKRKEYAEYANIEGRPIYPIGDIIINHPKMAKWKRQGYAKYTTTGLWLQYAAVCELIRDLQRGRCTIPPEGWWCSRDAGHDGPCAARRVAYYFETRTFEAKEDNAY